MRFIIIIINIFILAHMGGCWQALRSPPRLNIIPVGTQAPWTILPLEIPDVLATNSQTLASPRSPSPQDRSGTARTDVGNSLFWHRSVGTGRIGQCQGLLQVGFRAARICSWLCHWLAVGVKAQ